MDNNITYQNLQASAKFNNLQLLMRTTLQVVVWVSLFSLFLCYSTGDSLFPNSFSVYFSTYLFSLFTRKLERKYMFLICNGLLAFLAKSSSVSCSSSSSSPPLVVQSELSSEIPSSTGISNIKESVGNSEEDGTPFVAEDQKSTEEEAEEQAEDQGSEYLYRDNYNEEEKSEAMKEEDEDNVEDGSGLSLVKQEEEEEEVEGTTTANEELASTEELNKKFEEFIRKMKEEIRIEAQQQQQRQLIVAV